MSAIALKMDSVPTIYLADRQQVEDVKVAIAPASASYIEGRVVEKAAEPIKEMDVIQDITATLIDKKMFREAMVFVTGINTGLRASDLLSLQFFMLLNENGTFKDEIVLLEKKTSHSRKTRKNRHIPINDAVKRVVSLYLQHTHEVCRMDDFLFKSCSNRTSGMNKPMTVRGLNLVLKKIYELADVEVVGGTHVLRKTFGYQYWMGSEDKDRALLLVQKAFNHSSQSITLAYLGLTQDEVADGYLGLNLGF